MTQLIVEQALNGLQFGLMLFLLAAGLTLVFGIMDMINLAHGSLYMAGAYLAAAATQASGSFLVGIAVAMPASGRAKVGMPQPSVPTGVNAAGLSANSASTWAMRRCTGWSAAI